MSASTPSWKNTLLSRNMLICAASGFSSGLPMFLLISLLPAWLKSEGVNLKAIGLFALVQLPFTWKFLWAPLFDRFIPPLGRRRGWMLITQVLLIASIPLLGQLQPQTQLSGIIYLCGAIAFFSASQDIAIDAYRRDFLTDAQLGIGNAIFVNAYKIAGLVPGSLALVLADHLAWREVYGITALFMLPGLVTTLLVAEPTIPGTQPRTLKAAVVEPFQEFITRRDWKYAAWVLLFMLFYKLGDSMAVALATPFYMEMGFSKTQIGLVAKNVGLAASVTGGILGGIWMIKLGINRALWLFGLIQMFAILGFAWLASLGVHTPVDGLALTQLGMVIGMEAFGVGLGTSAFVAFIAQISNPRYTATQYALFSSIVAIPRTFANAGVGYLVSAMGWVPFYVLCFVIAIPGMLLLFKVAPWREERTT